MQKMAKTKKLRLILSTILSAVFALTVGISFAATSITNNYTSTPNSVSAYLGNNSYRLINDASSILFGEGFHNNEISIEYSYCYNFDVRIKYSMSWSGSVYKYIRNSSNVYKASKFYSKSGGVYTLEEGVSAPADWETNYFDYYIYTNVITTDSVILNFYDRDNWIVDDSYIFHTSSISSGRGTLKILSGVNFIDPYDDNYLGLTLSINIIDIKIVKDDASYIDELFDDNGNLITLNGSEKITSYSSEAAAGYYHYLTNCSKLDDPETNKAFVIAYNPRYTGLNGAIYPDYETAWSRTGASASWLGCNRYNANVGIYVIVGGTDVRLTAKVNKNWRNVGAEMNPTNNIMENFNSLWDHNEYDASDNEECYFDYYLEAGTTAYIPVVDSFEITSEIKSGGTRALYTECQAYIETLILNGTSFSFNSSAIDVGEISTVSNGKNNKYNATGYTVDNQTEIYSGLFRNETSGTTTMYVPVYITNDSDNDLEYNLTYKLKYRIGNGKSSTNATPNTPTTFNNGSNYFFEYEGYVTNGATSYYTVNGNDFNDGTYGNDESVYVKAHSVKQIVYYYQITEYFESVIASRLSSLGVSYTSGTDFYDVWTSLGVEISSTATDDASNISTFVVKDSSSVKVYVRNNTADELTLTALSVNVNVYALTENYDSQIDSSINAKPADWNSDFWRYMIRTSTSPDTWAPNTSSTYSGVYKKLVTYYAPVTPQSLSFSGTLLPDETICLGTLAGITASDRVAYNLDVEYSTSSSTSAVKLINSGTANAYIENFDSLNSYYVRFTGTYSGSDARIQSSPSYNYYIGIIRPNQIFALPMSASGVLTYIAVSNTEFSASDLSTWAPGDTIMGYYSTYFN